MDTLDFVEKQADRLASFRLETMELLNKRAHTLATVLLGGAGAAAVYYLKTIGEGAASLVMARHLLSAAVWLFAVAAVVVWKCLRTGLSYPPGEEPAALLDYTGDLSSLRQGCLRTLDLRTRQWADRNTTCGVWLNHCYLAAILTPIVAMMGAAGLAAVASLCARV